MVQMARQELPVATGDEPFSRLVFPEAIRDLPERVRLAIAPPAFGLRNVIPFCLKIEMLLESLGISTLLQEQPALRKAARGNVPVFVVDGLTTTTSESINAHLDVWTAGRILNGLSEEERTRGTALSRLTEDHLNWALEASRWLDPQWRPHAVASLFNTVPRLFRPAAGALFFRQMKKALISHGVGRHGIEEQRGFAIRQLSELNAAVKGSDFLFGGKPTVYDFTIASHMACIYHNQPATWLTNEALLFAELFQYTSRVEAAVGVYAAQRPEPRPKTKGCRTGCLRQYQASINPKK